jgi:glycosyltransferase involved in cell wall biosynthesis
MISAIILTKNEEERIEACLKSVEWADEVVVVDCGTDRTQKIAKKMGAKVYFREFDNYVNQKNWAAEKVTGDWLFYLDADERVLQPLKNEILSKVKETDCSAFALSRINVILGKEERYGPFWPDWIIRLVKKSDFKGWTGEVHETLNFSGKLGYSKNSLLHLTHRNVDQIVLKSLNWSNIDARLRLNAHHPKMSSWRFLRILATELFYQGVIRKGFFSGTRATIDALMQTFSLVMTYAKLWELQQPKPLDEVYRDLDKRLIENGFEY